MSGAMLKTMAPFAVPKLAPAGPISLAAAFLGIFPGPAAKFIESRHLAPSGGRIDAVCSQAILCSLHDDDVDDDPNDYRQAAIGWRWN